MTAKEYLLQIDRIDTIINHKISELNQYKELSRRVKGVSYGERVQTSAKKGSGIENAVLKIVSKEEEIDKMIDDLIETKSRIISELERLDNTMFYRILFARYLENKELEIIAKENCYSPRQIYRLHGEALAEFEEKYADKLNKM